ESGPLALVTAIQRGSVHWRCMRGDLVADALRAGQAAFPFPDREGALESLTRLVGPARALEDRSEILVCPALEPDVVRLGLRSGDGSPCELLRLLEIAAPR